MLPGASPVACNAFSSSLCESKEFVLVACRFLCSRVVENSSKVETEISDVFG